MTIQYINDNTLEYQNENPPVLSTLPHLTQPLLGIVIALSIRMKLLNATVILASISVSLAGCGEPVGSEADYNNMVSIDQYTHLDITRGNAAQETTVSIDIQNGNATLSVNGINSTCIVSNTVRDSLYSILRQINVYKKTDGSACPAIYSQNREKFYGSGTEIEIDGCAYFYQGNSEDLINTLYSTYLSYCRP